MQTNIDPIRAEIMRLETVQVFEGEAWERVLADMKAAGRWAGVADAERRMRSAQGWQMIPVNLAQSNVPVGVENDAAYKQ